MLIGSRLYVQLVCLFFRVTLAALYVSGRYSPFSPQARRDHDVNPSDRDERFADIYPCPLPMAKDTGNDGRCVDVK